LVEQENSTKPIRHLVDFFQHFQVAPGHSYEIDFYRGHSSHEYDLKPSLFRKKSQRKDEKNILRELISLHPSEFVSDRNVFEQLVRMQHYNLPTRLLDLTYNPLVALYFACRDQPRTDGELITLSVRKSEVRYFDSDTVSCVAGLSNLTGGERDALRDIDDFEELNNSHAGKRLLQSIRAEKPYFLSEINPRDLRSIQVVRPKLNNRRLIAQQGAFLLFGLTSELRDDDSNRIKIFRVRIPKAAKGQLLRELDRINVNEGALFPEIDHAANYIMSKIAPLPEEQDLS
jgi:hypothetical protein